MDYVVKWQHPYVHQAFTLCVTFLLTYRSQLAYQRFWEARTHMTVVSDPRVHIHHKCSHTVQTMGDSTVWVVAPRLPPLLLLVALLPAAEALTVPAAFLCAEVCYVTSGVRR